MDETATESSSYNLSKASRAGGPVTCVKLVKATTEEASPASDDPQQQLLLFVLAAQGPYISRYPLAPCDDSKKSTRTQENQQREQQLLAFPDGTVHGIHFLHDSYHDDRQTNDHDYEPCCWDSVVFGGHKLSFCNLLGENMICRDVITNKQQPNPCLTMSDWIWTVKTFRGDSATRIRGDAQSTSSSFVMVVGFARHFLEVWTVTTPANSSSSSVHPTCLRRIYVEPSTMVTSMDLFWKQDRLWVAAGTSFYKIWVSCVALEEGEETSIQTTTTTTSMLEEHGGVVHAIKFSTDGMALASTSDDRSVRKWKWDDKLQTYRQQWVGWGHSARVWAVSFASDDDSLLVSVSEDGTARVRCGESGKALACIHHAAPSGSLWTVGVLGDLMVMGATDGIISTHNLQNRIRDKNLSILDSVAIPDDRPKEPLAPLPVDKEDTEGSTNSGKKKKKKKRVRAQVIVGMKWWQCSSSHIPRLMVATREGSLYSFDTISLTWEDFQGWCDASLSTTYGIEASNGCCMTIRPCDKDVAFGTTRGYVVLVSVQDSKAKLVSVLNGSSLKSVNGMTWLDSSTLVSFHVRSVAVWIVGSDNYDTSEEVTPSEVLTIDTKGVPMSCAYNQETRQMVIGDSRGSISLFSMAGDETQPTNPLCVLPRGHQKEHVSSLRWVNSRTVMSVGNDGSLNVSYMIGDSLCKGWSFPASLMSGVSRIFDSQCSTFLDIAQSPVLIGGYYGNTFRMVDVKSGYESIEIDTGGRQRILDCKVDSNPDEVSNMPTEYSLSVCMGEQDGSNSVFIQQLKQDIGTDKPPTTYPSVARGVKIHGETIFGSTMFTLMDKQVQFLVTASEDCTTRMSAWQNGKVIDSLMLDPQVSCVRCVSSSQIDETSVLLAIGGGKLMIQFFLIQAWPDKAIESVHDLRITYLGKGTTGKKEEAHIDHRFNAVKGIPLDNKTRSHLVVAGDSNGFSHIFVMPEDVRKVQDQRSTLGVRVHTSDRPILSVEAITINNRILVSIGTTTGDILLYDLPSLCSQLQEQIKTSSTMWTLIDSYQGHQMGTNALSAFFSSNAEEDTVGITVVSGGDDHSLSFAHLNVQQKEQSDRLCVLDDRLVQSVPGASFSAIKSVHHLTLGGEKCILSAGYSQTLSLWSFSTVGTTEPQVASTARIDLGDVNCMAFCEPSNDKSEVWVAACGMGVEMFKLCRP